MDAAESRHVVLGIIFQRYISDAFEKRQAQLLKEVDWVQIPKIQTSIGRTISSECPPKPGECVLAHTSQPKSQANQVL